MSNQDYKTLEMMLERGLTGPEKYIIDLLREKTDAEKRVRELEAQAASEVSALFTLAKENRYERRKVLQALQPFNAWFSAWETEYGGIPSDDEPVVGAGPSPDEYRELKAGDFRSLKKLWDELYESGQRRAVDPEKGRLVKPAEEHRRGIADAFGALLRTHGTGREHHDAVNIVRELVGKLLLDYNELMAEQDRLLSAVEDALRINWQYGVAREGDVIASVTRLKDAWDAARAAVEEGT